MTRRKDPPPAVIVLPLPPSLANERWHWRTKARKQANYKLLCQSWHPERPAEPLENVIISATLYGWALRDHDNAVASLKWPIDWLVDREIILDDHPSCLELGEVRQEIDRKNQRLVLEIRPR